MFTNWRKKRARAKALDRRRIAHESNPEAAAELVRHFPDEIWPGVGAVVAGYHAVNSEIDPIRLMETFHCEQARLALPRVAGPGAPLAFHQWLPGDELETCAHGIATPHAEAPQLVPSILLVPLLAIDERGYRLGYGGGYYDRTLAALRSRGTVVAIGLGYEVQRVRKLPVQTHDQRLDWMITENGAYRFG